MHRTLARRATVGGATILVAATMWMVISVTAGATYKQPKPTISSYTASPLSQYGWLGGPITLSATVTDASTCTISSNKPVTGLPVTVDCSGGTVSQALVIPPKWTKGKGITFKFKLRAVGARATTAKLSVLQAPEFAGCSKLRPLILYVDCDLTGADLSNQGPSVFPELLEGANLTFANLSNDNLSDLSLARTTLSSTNLSGTILTGVASGHIIGTPAELPPEWTLLDGYLVGPGANLAFAYLVGTTLTAAHLSGAILENSYLANASLVGADLSNARFLYADLTGADLTDADLAGARMGIPNLTLATLTGVIWSNTTCPDGTNSDNDGGTCVNNL